MTGSRIFSIKQHINFIVLNANIIEMVNFVVHIILVIFVTVAIITNIEFNYNTHNPC